MTSCCGLMVWLLAESAVPSLAAADVQQAPAYLDDAVRPAISIQGQRVFPESLTSTPDGTIVFGSLTGAILYRALSGETTAIPWQRLDDADQAIYGVLDDPERQTLWVCVVDRKNHQTQSELKVLAMPKGTPQNSYPLPSGGVCNDIAVAQDGEVFVTDIAQGRVLSLLPGENALHVWRESPQLKGIDGIVVIGHQVFANNFRSGELYAFDRDIMRDTSDRRVLSTSRVLNKPDGMRALPDGRILLVEGSGSLSQIRFTHHQAVVDTLYEGFDGPTSVTLARGQAWVLESKLRLRASPQNDPGSFRAVGVPMP